MKQNQKGRRGRQRNQSRRNSGGGGSNGRRDNSRISPRNHNQARQQVEKYMSLGREAIQLQDFVEAENCFQHAEYFQRLLGELTASQESAKPRSGPSGEDGKGKPNSNALKTKPPVEVIPIETKEEGKDAAGKTDDEAISA